MPALRQGTGSVVWDVYSEVDPELVREAVITLGTASQNQVVLPLADPSAVVTNADIPVEAPLPITDYPAITIKLNQARVQFGSRDQNEPYEAGTARLVMDVTFSAGPDLTWEDPWGEWMTGDVWLLRPDGVSVAPDHLWAAVDAGERAYDTLVFEIPSPPAGGYVLSFRGQGEVPEVSREVVVP